MLKKFFFDHPAEAGETYGEHLAFTATTAWELVCIGAALLIHGIFPFLFTTTASGRITRVYQILTVRALKISHNMADNHNLSAAASRKAA